MRISTASLALAAVLAAPVISTASSAAAGSDLSPEQSQVLFQARKTWVKDNCQRRVELLQSQQRCIDAAASADALKTCRREMKKARKSQALAADQAASRAATPGSTLPSSSSRLAPPPVEM